MVGAPSRPVKFARFDAMRSDMVEIVIGDLVGRAGGDADPDRLSDAIRAVRKALSLLACRLCCEHAA